MSASSGSDVIHGAQEPTQRWWRRYQMVPLIVLLMISAVAATLGWSTSARLTAEAARPAPLTPSAEATSAVAAACTPAVTPPAVQPWIGGDGEADQVWADHAQDLDGPVVAGRDGWAFYNDQIEENFSQTIGRRYLTIGEPDAWTAYLRPLAEALAQRDVELWIVVSPTASSVYPQQLPEWTDDILGSTALDQLLASDSDLPLVDVRRALQKASADEAVYTPVNSHWTDWGGYIAWQAFADCHDAAVPDRTPIWVPAVTGVKEEGVYNEYASYGVADSDPKWTAPVYAETLADVEVTINDGSTEVRTEEGVGLSDLPASTLTTDAQSDQTALILRDSMGDALSVLWDQQYAQTWQIQHRYDDWSNPPNFRALVDQYNPDVVIVQFAERHLGNAPPSGITTGF